MSLITPLIAYARIRDLLPTLLHPHGASTLLSLNPQPPPATVSAHRLRAATWMNGRSKVISQVKAREILVSPRIAGLRRSDGKPVTANWPAIITKEQHEELVAILGLQRRQRPGGQASRRVYLLGGLAVCGRCGHRLTGKPSFGKRRYYYYYYYYYYCDPKLGGLWWPSAGC